MGALFQDLRYAVRQVRKAPMFTLTAVAVLALGIGVNVAVFSVVQAVILRPLPYQDPNRLVHITDPQDPQDGGILYNDLTFLAEQNQAFANMAVYYRDSGWSRVILTGTQEPEAVQGAFVTASLFPVLGMSPILGRTFTPEEESRHDRVVVLSYRLWRRRFAGSSDVLGRALRIDGQSSRVIGVMPQTFQFPARDSQFWAPITTNRYWEDPAANSNDGSHSRGFYARWQGIGRLRKDVSLREVQTQIDTIFRRLESAAPDSNRGGGIKAMPLQVEVNGNIRAGLYVLFAAVCLVLLIACTNVAHLVLARGVSRSHEIALRTALGASRGRILQQSLAETVLLGVLSGLLSLPVAFLGIRALILLGPPDIPRLQEAGLNLAILGFASTIAILCAAVLGLVSAVRNWHADPSGEMKSKSAMTSDSISLTSLRSILIVAEVALSVVLLTGAGLLVRSLLIVASVDPGFDPEHVLIANVSLPGGSSGWSSNVFDSIFARLQSLPGVKDTGAIDSLFDLGPTDNLGLRSMEGHVPEPGKQWTALTWDTVRGDYFQTIGAPLLRGRYFSDQDGLHSPLVAIIDESAARRYWPGENALGKRFKGQDRRGQNDDWLTVIGVVRDISTHGLERQPTPHIYEWYRQSGNATPDLVVRAARDPGEIAATLHRAIRGVAPAAILSNIVTVDRQLTQQLAPRRFQASLLGLFSLLALLLASVGVYVLMHYSVAQRTREIGIRMALGAERRSILTMVVRQGLVLVSLGLGAGLALASVATRLLSGLLYGVKPFDPLTLASVFMLLLGVALVASFVPAHRAASIDPMIALRSE